MVVVVTVQLEGWVKLVVSGPRLGTVTVTKGDGGPAAASTMVAMFKASEYLTVA